MSKQLNPIILAFGATLIAGVFLGSCRKDDSKIDYGFSNIYMPQAITKSGGVNNNYPIPSGTDSSTYNYFLDTQNNKLNVILGAALSGSVKDSYSVDIQVNNDTIQKMFNNKVYDTSLYKLMPAAMYTIPTKLDVLQSGAGTFNVSVDITQLKSNAWVGKFLLLAVKLANPSKYTLNSSISTTVLVFDINSLVIGPAIDITSQYILNPGNPFIASAMNGSRWGTLKSWLTNAPIISHGGVGGYSSDGDGQTMDLESGWGSPAIYNGKLYQTITLPPGTYAFDPSGGTWKWQGTLDPTYAVVAPGVDTLPNYSNIAGNSSVMYQQLAQPQPTVLFQLTSSTKITLGVVVNYIKDQQGFKSTGVKLVNYPKHL